MALIFLGGLLYFILHVAPKFDPKNKAEEYLRNNQFFEAINEYKKILNDRPLDFITHYRLAEIYFRTKDFDNALVHYEMVLSIGNFNYEVDKVDIQKKVANIYMGRDDFYNAFKISSEILKSYPSNEDALYNTAFISLGQEEFEFSQRQFSKLIKLEVKNFNVYFAAGISAYQNQKGNESIEYFRKAVELKPDSEIANLAMALALKRKSNYNKSYNFVTKLLGRVTDPDVLFVLMRLEAFLLLHLRRYDEALKKFEILLQFAKSNGFEEESLLTEYDLGFACIMAEKTGKAYDYWNKLGEKKRIYKNLQNLIMTLRREMDSSSKDLYNESISDFVDDWMKNSFSNNLLWDICGLKSEEKVNLRDILTSMKAMGDSKESSGDSPVISSDVDYINSFVKLDTETFRIISNRLVEKIGYKVDQILTTYKESDGVDFMAKNKDTGAPVYVWVRRWTKMKVGEISLRNLAQAVNDMKAKEGVLMTTAELTEGALNSMDMLKKIRVVLPDELNKNLKDIM